MIKYTEAKMKLIATLMLVLFSISPAYAEETKSDVKARSKNTNKPNVQPTLSWHQNRPLLNFKILYVPGKKEYYANLKK